MADQKLTALTEDTAPASTDYAYTVKDPAGTPLSRRSTWLNILKGAYLGIATSDNDIIARVAGAAARVPVAASTFLGRKASGDITAMTVAEARTLLGRVDCLAFTFYNPSGGVVTKTTTSTLTAIDTTNMRATFTAPTSGNVIVQLGGGRLDTGNCNPHFGVLDGATTKGTNILTAANAALREGPTITFHVTGLTPGNSYSYDFAIVDTNSVGGSHATLKYGYSTSNLADATGPVHIGVWAAP